MAEKIPAQKMLLTGGDSLVLMPHEDTPKAALLVPDPQAALLDALGGEPLAWSGFEDEMPEPGFIPAR